MLQVCFVNIIVLAVVTIALANSPVNTLAARQTATVTIDATQTDEPISKYIYGQFIEHLGRCIYGVSPRKIPSAL